MNSIASPSWSRLFLVVFSGLLLSVSTGCGASNEDWVPGDKDLCKALVSDLSEARTSVEKMRKLFVDGAVPDQQWIDDTADKLFVVKAVSISGDEADVEVEFENHFGDILNSNIWKCKRVNDQWKLMSVELPN